MFQFPGSLPHALCIRAWVTSYDGCRVPPFGYRRIFASLPLPVAFRRSVRPSSVPSGQAFAVRPSLLDLFVFSEILDIPFTVDIKSDILEQIAVAKKYYPEAVLVNIMKKHLCYWAKSARLPKKTNLVFTSLKSYGEMLKAVETYF